MDELKPCPFCNGTHSINVINFFTRDSFRKCDICGAEAPEAKTPEEAAEKWNTRPAEDALTARNKELVETVKSLEKTIGRAEKVLGERNLLAAEVERLKAALEDIKDRLLDRTCLNFGEAMVARWIIQKVNEILSQAPTEAIDIHEAAYAPDMNDGTMADCVKQNGNHDTQPDLCVANNTEKEEALKAEIERLKATLNKIETHCESEIEFGSMWSSCAYKMILEIIKATSQESSEGKR